MKTGCVLFLLCLLLAPAVLDAELLSFSRAADRAAAVAAEVGAYSRMRPDAPGAFAPWTSGNLSVGQPLLVHNYPGLTPNYYIVPLQNEGGGAPSFVTLDARTGARHVYGRLPQDRTFPAISRDRARRLAREELSAEIPDEAMRLVEMPDKRLYWHARTKSGRSTEEIFIDLENPGIRHRGPEKLQGTFIGLPRPPGDGGRQAPGKSRAGRYPASYDIATVPHHYQETSYHCGPASAEMVLDYWGPDIDQTDIGYVVNINPSFGSYASDVRRSGHFSEISTAVQDPTLHGYGERSLGYGALDCWWSYPNLSDPDYPDRYNDLKNLISSDLPILVLTWYSESHGGGHFRVIKGYDDNTDVFIVHDPWYTPPYQGPDLHFDQTFLVDNLWVYYYQWGTLIAPWAVTLTGPEEVFIGEQFTVTAAALYRGPHPYEEQDTVSTPKAELSLPSGFALAAGETAVKPLAGLFASGSADTVSWQVLATAPVTAGTLGVKAVGQVSDYSNAYPSYADDIGDLASCLVNVNGLPSPDPDWTDRGDQESCWFGTSVSGAGDVDGDGYEDIIVGASLYSNGQDYEGRACLYTGSAAGLSLDPVWTAENDSAYSYFGNAVDRAGDVNGDGYSDVIIGAEGYPGYTSERGAAYAYFGSPSGLAASPGWMTEGAADGAHLGFSVSGAGDVNGNGYSDVIVGAPYEDGSGTDEGAAYLFLGGPGGPSPLPDWTVRGQQNSAHLGYCVAAAGDVNGDGYADVALGAESYDDSMMIDVGAVFLFLGGPEGLPGSPDWQITGDAEFGYLGRSVSGAGDVNADGFSDLVVGAPGYTAAATGEGRVMVFLGSATGLSQTPAATLDGGQQGRRLGHSVSGAGDWNGDGYGDVFIGSEAYDGGQSDEGCVELYLGRQCNPYLIMAWEAESNQPEAYMGYCVSAAGDVDGDGYGEVLAGAYLYDAGSFDEGRADLFLGRSVPSLLSFRPRQVRAGGSGLIGPLGASDSETQFRLRVTGWYPGGSDSVKLQWEVKPLGTGFDSTGMGQSSAWSLADSSLGVELDEMVAGLSPNTPYHWRARVLYHPENPLGLDHSHWLSPAHNGVNETDLRTAGGGVSPPEAVDDLAAALVPTTKSETGGIVLTWTRPGAPGGLSHFVIYRSPVASEEGDSLGSTADTLYLDGGAAGDTLVNHYYSVRTVDGLGQKSESSNHVGEFDRGLTVGK